MHRELYQQAELRAAQHHVAVDGLIARALRQTLGDAGRTLTQPDRGLAEEWTSEKNARRCDLIDKQIEGSLSAEEQVELADLQRQAMAYRDRVAPLPMEGTRRLRRELLEKKRRSEAREFWRY